jgi:hypothetical protein
MYLRRAEKLKGLTGEQLLSLKAMKTDVAYYTARRKLEDGQRQVEEALAQLKIAADTDNKHARSANQMIVAVEPQARALAEALRTAVNSLSAPAPVAAPPAPVPAPVAAAPDAGR